MFPKSARGVAALILLASWRIVGAQTIYNDGGVHTVSGPSGPITVEGTGTTLNVVSPASVTTAVTGNPQTQRYAILSTSGTTIDLAGGQAAGISAGGDFSASGGNSQGGGAEGLQVANSTATAQISGGTFQGAAGAAGAFFSDSSTLITGGRFEGGFASGTSMYSSGDGVFAIMFNPVGNIQITDGTFIGGDAGANGIGGNGLRIYIANGNTATITGGTFVGGSGGTGDGSSLLVDMRSISSSPLARLDVTGGTFSSDILFYPNNGYLNFFGSGFSFDQSTGLFTGTLDDGTTIDVIIKNGFNASLDYITNPAAGEVTFTGASFTASPEPSSMLTVACAVTVLAASQAYRRVCVILSALGSRAIPERPGPGSPRRGRPKLLGEVFAPVSCTPRSRDAQLCPRSRRLALPAPIGRVGTSPSE